MSRTRASFEQGLASSATATWHGTTPNDANAITLALADLTPDKTGSIVIETGGHKLWLEINGYEEVLRRGIAPEDSHSEHFDVSGMDFIKFLNGTVLYYSADEVHLVLGRETFPAIVRLQDARSLASVIDYELNAKPIRRH